MNAPLSLHNRPAPSLAEQARRLEAFEIALREERISELEQERDSAVNAAILKINLQDGDVLQVPEPSYPLLSHLSKAVNSMGLKQVLFICGELNHLDEEAQRTIAEPFLAKQREKICQLQQECQQLQDAKQEFEKAGNQLADDKEQLQAEVQRLAVQDTANSRVLAKTQQQLKEAQAEVKRLKALDPDRLSKQVKRLQKKRTEAVEGAKKMRTRNHQLAKQNRQLDAALDKAIAEANSGEEMKPAHVFDSPRVGRWELFTCAKDGWYQMLDAENEVSQTVRVEGGELITPKMRPLPKLLATAVLEFHQEHFGGAV
ncbi:hypothetical protein [Marinobacterium stanieri]|uniref:Uncharacterized protein n=1 Tax=Marinobacterium stanieri TaxID=49186 RepID=A0A1N6Q4A4_9GAMM|nr:hypothetical protein [Marinobacterium stanieri]SIQ11377.1 hypothetical protein SAMN05421647_102244 [Marinobacterium stanieri]